jgi:hypothetical protein
MSIIAVNAGKGPQERDHLPADQWSNDWSDEWRCGVHGHRARDEESHQTR